MNMEREEASSKEKLMQELRSLGPALVSQFEAARASTKDGTLEALRLIVEGKGTCRLKVKDWPDPIFLNGIEEKTVLLQTFLLLLWQYGSLEKVSYDPVDLRIAREKVVKADCSAEHNSGNPSSAEDPSTENVQESNSEVDVKEQVAMARVVKAEAESMDELEVLLAEDGTNYLAGPREIDLARKDFYHPLFSSYRRSADIRQENFLSSSHLLHVRKLSGIDVYDFGYEFCQGVLQKAAPSVEDLTDSPYRLEHLNLYRDLQFPRLHRLCIWMRKRSNILDESDFQFATPQQDNVGLRWLCARLPRQALGSLLRHNAKTLVELKLQVGTRASHAPVWPMQCDDLEVFLMDCGLHIGALRKLTLNRDCSAHTRAECELQVQAVKRNLPSVTVVCDMCSALNRPRTFNYYIEHHHGTRQEWAEY